MTAPRPGRRAAVLAAVTVLLAVAAVVLLVAGVEVRETTGGLLVTPFRQRHLIGGFLLAGTAAGVGAVVTSLWAVPALRRARRGDPGAVEDGPVAPAAPAAVEDTTAAGAPGDGDPARAGSSPGSDGGR